MRRTRTTRPIDYGTVRPHWIEGERRGPIPLRVQMRREELAHAAKHALSWRIMVFAAQVVGGVLCAGLILFGLGVLALVFGLWP
jgi:hypothetical protein